MYRHRIVAVALAVLPILASAQSRFLQSTDEGRTVTEGIVASVASGNMTGALKDLQPLSVIQPTDFDVFKAQLNSQQDNILRSFGPPSGYEYVRFDKLGTRLARFQYLVFHEKAAMRWNFVLYKAEKGWVISHFAFDANAVMFFSHLD
jgi:hypothetical protein